MSQQETHARGCEHEHHDKTVPIPESDNILAEENRPRNATSVQDQGHALGADFQHDAVLDERESADSEVVENNNRNDVQADLKENEVGEINHWSALEKNIQNETDVKSAEPEVQGQCFNSLWKESPNIFLPIIYPPTGSVRDDGLPCHDPAGGDIGGAQGNANYHLHVQPPAEVQGECFPPLWEASPTIPSPIIYPPLGLLRDNAQPHEPGTANVSNNTGSDNGGAQANANHYRQLQGFMVNQNNQPMHYEENDNTTSESEESSDDDDYPQNENYPLADTSSDSGYSSGSDGDGRNDDERYHPQHLVHGLKLPLLWELDLENIVMPLIYWVHERDNSGDVQLNETHDLQPRPVCQEPSSHYLDDDGAPDESHQYFYLFNCFIPEKLD